MDTIFYNGRINSLDAAGSVCSAVGITNGIVSAVQSENSDAVAKAVGSINRQLYTHTSPDKFATLVLGRVDTRKWQLTYCNAGHNPPLLFSSGQIRRLAKGGIVAGLFGDPHYEQETIQLGSGDLIVFYTDGVVEAENPKGEQFEENRLEELIRSNAFLTADDIRSLILEEVTDWVRGQEQRDDITVVTLKVEEMPALELGP